MHPARRSTKDLSERKGPRNKTKEALDCYRSAIMYARPVMLHGKRMVPGCASKAPPGFWPAAIMTSHPQGDDFRMKACTAPTRAAVSVVAGFPCMVPPAPSLCVPCVARVTTRTPKSCLVKHGPVVASDLPHAVCGLFIRKTLSGNGDLSQDCSKSA